MEAGLELEAEAVERVLLEAALHVAWMLAKDPLERSDRLLLRDLDQRIEALEDLKSWVDLSESEQLKQLETDIANQTKARDELLKSYSPPPPRRRLKRPPDFRQLVDELSNDTGVDYRSAYDFAYRHGSRARVHANLMAIDAFVQDRPLPNGDRMVDEDGPGTRSAFKPYVTSAQWLAVALAAAAARSPSSYPWNPRVSEIGQELLLLR